MKRRSHKPRRDRELEEIIARTRHTMPLSEYRAQRERDKAILQERLKKVFVERSQIQRGIKALDISHFTLRDDHMQVERALEIVQEDISSYTATLRAVKQELAKL